MPWANCPPSLVGKGGEREDGEVEDGETEIFLLPSPRRIGVGGEVKPTRFSPTNSSGLTCAASVTSFISALPIWLRH